MKPNAPNSHFPDPGYLKRLCEAADLSPRKAAAQIGIGERVMRYYLTPAAEEADFREAPYPVQFALEHLAYGDQYQEEAVGSLEEALEKFEPLAYLIVCLGGLHQDGRDLARRVNGDEQEKKPVVMAAYDLVELLESSRYLTSRCGKAFKAIFSLVRTQAIMNGARRRPGEGHL